MEKLNIFKDLEKTQKAIVLKRLKEKNDDLGLKIAKIPDELIPELITELENELNPPKEEKKDPQYSDEENSNLNDAVKSIFR